MRNYEGKKERRKRKIYSISGINFYLSKGEKKEGEGREEKCLGNRD